MRRASSQGGKSRQAHAQFLVTARRLVAILLLLSFWVQFGRYYMPPSADPHLCPEEPLAEEANEASHTHGGHSHHSHRDLAPAPEPEDGQYFDHCKEFFHGFGLSSAPPMIAEAVKAHHWAPLISVALQPKPLPFPQADLSVPFHPPRHFV